ncbi:MAG: polysaccharide deacetylase family protein [Bacteroidales bacterium]|jgi:polysaccharide deacetylase family protein (PEP-CTERM system associated)|nr:polysaccharide deacetylase family protein [Bacteroidales bacterium]
MHILTFDIEEWFHLLDNESTKGPEEWVKYPCRIYENMDRIFALLDRHNRRATFFVLGWIAQKYPDVVKRISDNGFDLGFHTTNHQLIHEQTPEDFYADIVKGLDCLENIVGKKVESFRAPGFSLTESCNWAFDILAELGIKYDSSVFPMHHAHGGYPSFPHIGPALIKTHTGDIKEFPISVGKLFGKSIVYSGGGYFRLFPYTLIKTLARKETYLMSYLHPRDMDAGQPMIKDLPLSRKFKSYVGLKTCAAKFEHWINDFPCIDICTAASIVDWAQVPVVDLKKTSQPLNPELLIAAL